MDGCRPFNLCFGEGKAPSIRLRFGGAATLIALLLTACGGGSGTSAGPAPAAAGSLTVENCRINDGGVDCQIGIGWTSQNADAPRVVVGGTTVAQSATGSFLATIPFGDSTVTLEHADGTLDQATVNASCHGTADWDGATCVAVAVRFVEFIPTPFMHEGEPVMLEVVIFRPIAPGVYPTMMFNHGSTGFGDDPSLFTRTFVSGTILQFLTRRGWAVAFPQRRGRGQSGGLYDEGFLPDRSGYSCEEEHALPGIERALDDMDVIVDWLGARADVDETRVVSAGFSRGGLLSIIHTVTRPGVYIGAVNFVGGWLLEGCGDAQTVTRQSFLRGAPFPGESLWIYGVGDSFYSIEFSRSHFDAFIANGGAGTFLEYTRAPGLDGHYIINDRDAWEGELADYLDALP